MMRGRGGGVNVDSREIKRAIDKMKAFTVYVDNVWRK